MRAFDYAAPKTLTEAVALLEQWGERARVLSGGTDLIVQVREDRRDLDLMIDAKHIPEMTELVYDPATGLTLGAAVACQRMYDHPAIRKAYPGLIDSAELIGGTQIQNRASFGGNLCNSSPAADFHSRHDCLFCHLPDYGSRGNARTPCREVLHRARKKCAAA